MSDRFALIFSAYHPLPEHIAHMRALAAAGISVIVVDNSPDEVWRFDAQSSALSLTYHKNRNLGGIAGALNRGVDIARAAGHIHVVFLDQDSEIEPDAAGQLAKICEGVEADGRKAIVGASYFDRNLGTLGVSCKLTRFGYQRVRTFDEQGLAKVSLLISAGSCVSLRTFDFVGPFDERLFIDDVDTEHCLRAESKNVELLMTNRVVIQHSLGVRKTRRLLGLRIRPNNHSAVRRYFIFRNNIFSVRTYGIALPGFIALSFARLVHEVLSIVFYESAKVAKLRAILRGTWHGITGRLGPMS